MAPKRPRSVPLAPGGLAVVPGGPPPPKTPRRGGVAAMKRAASTAAVLDDTTSIANATIITTTTPATRRPGLIIPSAGAGVPFGPSLTDAIAPGVGEPGTHMEGEDACGLVTDAHSVVAPPPPAPVADSSATGGPLSAVGSTGISPLLDIEDAVSPATVAAGAMARAHNAQPQWKNDAFAPGWPSSQTVLLNWLNDGTNYEGWKGSEGVTHMSLASDVHHMIVSQRCRAERSPATIVEKIKAIEKAFRSASDWRLATGQGILDEAEAREEEEGEGAEAKESRLALVRSGVDAEVIKRCEWYNDVVGITGDRIGTNPTGSHSSTSQRDPAGAGLRRSVLKTPKGGGRGGNHDGGTVDEDVWSMSSDEDVDQANKAKGKNKKNEKTVKMEAVSKGRTSDTGRKFGKLDKSNGPSKRRPSAVELAIEQRSKERTAMDSELNSVKVKAERVAAVMSIARELRDADPGLAFQDAMEQAKAIFADI